MANKQDEVKITLELSEWITAIAIGIVRHGFALFKGSTPDWQDGNEAAQHLKGALAEGAYHKWRGVWWGPALNNYKGADAPGNVQIRSTSRLNPYHKVKPGDPDDQIAVFIESQERTHFLVGWLPIKAAKAVGHYEDPGRRDRPCFRVLPEQLLPMRTFPPTNVRSKCHVHGEYPGDGECPLCAAQAVA